jgi:DNA polymerase I-like protein with 3'-5' exonuclease and polymerase domains
MQPWLEIAERAGGTIHASYNQVRNPDGFGTRTGRLSSSKPNFQNVPNDLGPEFPVMRSYLLPDEGHVWTCGDFSSQEPRIAAHFEDGQLMEAYKADPRMDPYIYVLELVGGINRKESKAIFLGILYAQGAALLAEKLGCDISRANMLRNMIKAALTDVVRLATECKNRFQRGLPLRTLGGRLYYCEPPSGGRDWSYKALNTLIQGSAADQTKEAIIFANKEIKLLDSSCRVLGTVHDEYSISHPPHLLSKVREIMQLAANALPCDVPMIMDAVSGNTWAEAAK